MERKTDEDCLEKDDSKRKSRNLSEKKRRDQFNALVNELNILISVNNKKMDKSSILKSTISFLKNHKEVARKSKSLDIKENWKPSFLSNEEFIHLILEALDGFIIIFSGKGDILYISDSVTSLLGYLPNDLLLMTIYDIVYEMDHEFIFNISNGRAINKNMEEKTSFYCHLKRHNVDKRERLSYELVKFFGYFRYDIDFNHTIRKEGEQKNLIFVGIGRVQTPQLIKQMSIVNESQNEFLSKHSLEWKFLFLDHRAPPIIGYLPFEVLGTSGYDYYHYDDLEKVISSHEKLIQKGEGQSIFYRFLTKGQQWLWLKTRSHIQYHQSTNPKAELIVCVHQVVCYADVLKSGNIVETDTCSRDCENNKVKIYHKLNSKAKSAKHKRSKSYLRYGESNNLTDSLKLHSTYPIAAQHIVGHTFLEPQQYLAAIPVQPVIPTIPFATASPIIPNLKATPEALQGVSMTPATLQLQRKHDELQKRIISQQQELRRVSEQLIVAKNLQRFNIPISYNSSKQMNDSLSSYNEPNYENTYDINENLHSLYCGNETHNRIENSIPIIEQISFLNKNSNNESDHEDRNSNMNSTVTSNDLEILPYQLSHDQSQILFDNSNSSNDANSKSCR